MSGTMRAVVQDRYGPPADVLRAADVAAPLPGPGEVLVRVRAASVNAADWHLVRGAPVFVRLASGLRRPKHPIPGTDVAGVVEAVAAGVTRLRPGDEVLGWCNGAFAEQAVAPEDHFVARPPAITFEQAAAVPLAATTALQGLRDRAGLRAGQSVLVIGASGGVGTFAVQIAKALGAEVTGACSARNVELVRSIGADHVVDYAREDVTAGPARYDVIFQLGGTASPLALRHRLNPGGTLVLSSGQGRLSGLDRIAKAALASPFVGRRLVPFLATWKPADLAAVAELLAAGTVVPVVDRTYPLAETPAAVTYVEAGHTRGKVVITL